MNASVFLGKYRGIVVSNEDPLFLNRITARIPDVLGDTISGWALPCAPFGARQGGFFCLPDAGSNVWIEFEQGNPDSPIWSGCFWSSANDIPPTLNAPQPFKKTVIQTSGGHRLVLDDTPGTGGISLETSDGMKIALDPTGITLSNAHGATVVLSGPNVIVNKGR